MRFDRLREKMINEQIIGRGIKNEIIVEAFRKIPRHLFVEEALAVRAYDDNPLPIGEKQTISQPYTVALMTELLELKGTERVLEIGSGSGYQTAILAQLVEKVYSVERIKILVEKSRKMMDELRYYNVQISLDDGTLGWKDKAPFDRILVAAGSPEVPEPLLSQLAEDGKMIIPIGDKSFQRLTLIEKKEGKTIQTDKGEFTFVKLVGRHGWNHGA
ncbi:MAG: protein-L-isoaspartate(D-aspartate) O-methyltransferase [bacterium]